MAIAINNSEKMRNKSIIFVVLFSFCVPLAYLNLISSQLADFQEALEVRTTSGVPIYLTTVQLWVLNIISLLCDAIIVGIAVGLLSYYIKNIKMYSALLFGLISRYIIVIGVLLCSGACVSLFENVPNDVSSTVYLLIMLQVVSTLYFSYLGFNFGKRTNYVDAKDKDLYYLCGIPKKVWLLLFI